MEDNTAYIQALQRRLEELRGLTGRDKERIRELQEGVAIKEEQMTYIVKLLDAEGVSVVDATPTATAQMSVAGMAYEVLAARDNHDPVHYRELARLIESRGWQIPGQDPAANLIAHMGRDDRVIRTGRGMYALEQWGLRPAKPRASRRRSPKTKGKAT
jgi:hypothetical protein